MEKYKKKKPAPDAEVKVTVKTGGKTEYASPDLTFKRKESKLVEDASKVQDIMKAPCLAFSIDCSVLTTENCSGASLCLTLPRLRTPAVSISV